MSEEVDMLERKLDKRISALEQADKSTMYCFKNHEKWLNGHNDKISELEELCGMKRKQVERIDELEKKQRITTKWVLELQDTTHELQLKHEGNLNRISELEASSASHTERNWKGINVLDTDLKRVAEVLREFFEKEKFLCRQFNIDVHADYDKLLAKLDVGSARQTVKPEWQINYENDVKRLNKQLETEKKDSGGEKEVNLEASSPLNESRTGSSPVSRNEQDLANSKPPEPNKRVFDKIQKIIKDKYEPREDDDIRMLEVEGNMYWMPKMDMYHNIIVKREDLTWLMSCINFWKGECNSINEPEEPNLTRIKEAYGIE